MPVVLDDSPVLLHGDDLYSRNNSRSLTAILGFLECNLKKIYKKMAYVRCMKNTIINDNNTLPLTVCNDQVYFGSVQVPQIWGVKIFVLVIEFKNKCIRSRVFNKQVRKLVIIIGFFSGMIDERYKICIQSMSWFQIIKVIILKLVPLNYIGYLLKNNLLIIDIKSCKCI